VEGTVRQASLLALAATAALLAALEPPPPSETMGQRIQRLCTRESVERNPDLDAWCRSPSYRKVQPCPRGESC
jgi:hypothetical protein